MVSRKAVGDAIGNSFRKAKHKVQGVKRGDVYSCCCALGCCAFLSTVVALVALLILVVNDAHADAANTTAPVQSTLP